MTQSSLSVIRVGSLRSTGEAEDGTPVAVKVIAATLPDGRELHPLLQQREAEIAEKLRENPADHLVRILDVANKREERRDRYGTGRSVPCSAAFGDRHPHWEGRRHHGYGDRTL